MDAISSWAKENYQLICLLVSIIGVNRGSNNCDCREEEKEEGVVP